MTTESRFAGQTGVRAKVSSGQRILARKYGPVLIVLTPALLFGPGIRWGIWYLRTSHVATCNGNRFTFPGRWYVERRGSGLRAGKACLTVFCAFGSSVITIDAPQPGPDQEIWFNSAKQVVYEKGYSVGRIRAVGPAKCMDGIQTKGAMRTFVFCLDSTAGFIASYEGSQSDLQGFYDTLRSASQKP
jgi:hypothetical protein